MNRKIAAIFALVVGLLTLVAIPGSATPTAVPGAVTWWTRVDEASAEAARKNQLLLVDLYAEWCGWCKKLEKNVFSTPEFAEFAKDYVLLRVDVEDRAQGSELQARFGARTLPTTLILDGPNILVGLIPGYAPTEQLIAKIGDAVRTYQQSLRAYEQLTQSEDWGLVQQMAHDLHARGDGGRAATLYERIAQGMQEREAQDPTEEGWLFYQLADSYRLQGEFGRAEQRLAQARTLFQRANTKDVKIKESLDLLTFHIAQGRGDCQQAINLLKRFIADYPKSEARSQVSRTLQKLRRADGKEC